MIDAALETLAAAQNERQAARLFNQVEDMLTPLELVELGRRIDDPTMRAAYARRRTVHEVAEKPPEPYVQRQLAPTVRIYSDPARPPGGKTLLVAFAGRLQRLMVPTVALLQNLPAEFYDVVLLYDPAQQHFRGGCPDYGASFLGLIAALERDVPRARYLRSVAFGASMGGLPAIWYGLIAGTDRAICVGGRRPWDAHRISAGDLPPHAYDPLCACCTGGHTGMVFVHGSSHEVDRRDAEHYAAIVGGQVLAIPGMGTHSPLATLWQQHQLGRFLDPLFRARVFRSQWVIQPPVEGDGAGAGNA
jgi:hypothetical protein